MLRSTACFASCIASLVAAAPATGMTMFGTNLIANGGAESDVGGDGGTPPNVAITDWTDTGEMTVILWDGAGGWPTSGDPGPPARGSNFFSGGVAASSTITQLIDISDIAVFVDLGSTDFDLSGWLGGFGTQEDQTTLTARFLDVGATEIGNASLGPVTSTDRGSVTALLFRNTLGTLPVGTRSIEIELLATRFSGSSNDGYADELSLVLTSAAAAPEPGTALMVGLGLAALALRRRRR